MILIQAPACGCAMPALAFLLTLSPAQAAILVPDNVIGEVQLVVSDARGSRTSFTDSADTT